MRQLSESFFKKRDENPAIIPAVKNALRPASPRFMTWYQAFG